MSLNKRSVFRFDRFRLDGRERLLLRDGVAVAIGPKVLDALLLLVENSGKLVGRPTMRDRLWPGQIVEDGTLARVIADLRKALGDVGAERHFIETVPKFGYRFMASVVIEEEAPAASEVTVPLPPLGPTGEPPARFKPSKRNWFIGVAAVLVLLTGAGFEVRRLTQQPSVQSVLITPFEVIGKAPEGEMLRLGFQDSLTMELSGLSKLAVIKLRPQSTDATDDVAGLGRRHRSRFVLAGTIQLTDGRILVNARLVRSATGETVWTRRFEETLDEIFKVESRLAKLTVAQLIPTLPASEGERLSKRLPSNPSAHRYYLLGRHYWNKRDENAYDKAIENFKKSAEADSNYAPAYVGLADSYLLAIGSGHDPMKETLPLAKQAVERAIEIDPWLGDAHATLALIAESYYFDWDTTERELQTAIRLAPNYVTAHHWYAEFLTMMGKFDQAEAEFEVARNLDPASAIILTDLAQLYNFQKKYQLSIETLDEALKLDPSFHLAHDRKAYALMLMRRPGEALSEFETANRQAGRRLSTCEQAWVAAVEGRLQTALELTRRAEREDPNAFVLSVIWAELGDSDRAAGWLQEMYDMRGGGLISIKVNPVFDRLRSSQRFRTLLRQMNLT